VVQRLGRVGGTEVLTGREEVFFVSGEEVKELG
jgi:hypothetical protein